jgi:hypothetical protein
MVSNDSKFYKGKPKLNSNSKYTQGIYKPINPQKYIGDLNNIVFRSSLELKWYKYFDLNPAIVEWKCEETIIQYLNPVDNKMHRYFIDVYVKYKNNKKQIKEAIIEIKPLAQVKKPVKGNQKSKTFLRQVNTYIVNEAKWNAAKSVAFHKGIEFLILTETGFVEWTSTKL